MSIRSPVPSAPAWRLTLIWSTPSAESAAVARLPSSAQSTRNPAQTGISCPSRMFSATDSWGMMLSSWWMNRKPAAAASAVERSGTSSPFFLTVMASAGTTPASSLMKVDLPAPFSPMRA